MNRILFCILFILSNATIFAQEYIKVNTTYNKTERKELTVELVNKNDIDVVISNIRIGGSDYISYFELYFFDKGGQRIQALYPPPAFGIPFMNAAEIPKHALILKPNESLAFKYYVKESLLQYCKEPEKVKKMKLKFHIEYAAFKDGNLVKKDVFEEFSKTIKF